MPRTSASRLRSTRRLADRWARTRRLARLPIVYFGTEEQKARYLPRLASGELVGAYALTEPHSGSDALSAKTTARLSEDGKHYLLNGQKAWITNGGFADVFTIFAKVDGEKFTAFIVERGMGVVSGADEKKLGLDGSSTTVLMLDNVKVPVENVLGTIGEGHKVAFNILNLGRVKLGTRNISGARQALNQSIKYAKERRQFGKPICEFGLVKHKLAEMSVRCFVGESMVYRALGDVDRALAGIEPTDGARQLKTIETFAIECSINKVATSEALAYVVDEAVQVFGGNGYSREFPVERAYRDARITRIYEGTNEINRLIIPTRLLKNAKTLLANEVEAPPAGSVVAAEYQLAASAKRLAIAALAAASDAFGETVREEQEVLAEVANIVIEAYAIESAAGRVEKLAKSGSGRAAAGRGSDTGLRQRRRPTAFCTRPRPSSTHWPRDRMALMPFERRWVRSRTIAASIPSPHDVGSAMRRSKPGDIRSRPLASLAAFWRRPISRQPIGRRTPASASRSHASSAR